MPPLIGAAVAAAATAAVPAAGAGILGTTLSLSSILGAIVTSAASFGLQQLLAGKPRKTIRQEQATIHDSDPSRLVICGRYKVGGKVFAAHSVIGYYLFVGMIHCEGPIKGIYEYWINDARAWINPYAGGGVVGIPPWQAAVFYESKIGTVDQAASSFLISAGGLGWTSEHQLKGLAYTVQWNILPPRPEKYFQLTFPDGNPALRVVIDGCYYTDVRTDEVVQGGANNSLHIRNALIRERVDGVTGKVWRFVHSDDVDDDSFAAFADVCDQEVGLANGNTEPRYALNGAYSLDEEPAAVIERMLATCDAELVILDNGKIGIVGGVWEEPDLILTEDMFTGDVTYEVGVQEMDAFNQLKFKFTDPKNDYKLIEGDPWDDDEDQDERGIVLPAPFDFAMVQSHTQARRLAKIKTARMNPRHILRNCTIKMLALALVGRRTVRVQHPGIGIDAVFNIDRWEPSDDLSTVSVDLSSLDPAMYEWDPEAEEGTPPYHPNLLAPGEPPAAQSVVGVLTRRLISAGVYAVRLRVTAAAEAGWSLNGRYRPDGGGADDWLDMTIENPTSVISADLEDGQEYEFQARLVSFGGGTGPWSSIQSIVATSDQTPPSPPTMFLAIGGSQEVEISWKAPSSANVRSTRLYRAYNHIAAIEDAEIVSEVVLSPNQAYEMVDDGLAPGDFRYWVTALNGSGVESDPAGPIDVVVSW